MRVVLLTLAVSLSLFAQQPNPVDVTVTGSRDSQTLLLGSNLIANATGPGGLQSNFVFNNLNANDDLCISIYANKSWSGVGKTISVLVFLSNNPNVGNLGGAPSVPAIDGWRLTDVWFNGSIAASPFLGQENIRTFWAETHGASKIAVSPQTTATVGSAQVTVFWTSDGNCGSGNNTNTGNTTHGPTAVSGVENFFNGALLPLGSLNTITPSISALATSLSVPTPSGGELLVQPILSPDVADYTTNPGKYSAFPNGAFVAEKGPRWSLQSVPGAGGQAQVTRAASGGVAHVADCLAFSAAALGVTVAVDCNIVIQDGAGTNIWTIIVGALAAGAISQAVSPNQICGLNLVGTPGNAMIAQWGAGCTTANFAESISLSGYDIQ